MSHARYIVGPVLEALRSMPDASVDLVLTSSPFLALRSYLPADHPHKALEIGAEATPGAFIDSLLDVTEELRRVLALHGSLAWELGDTYAGSGGAGGDYSEGGLRDGQARFDGSLSRAHGTGSAPRPARARSSRPKYGGGNGRDRDIEEAAGLIPARTHSRREREGWPLNKSLCLVPELYRFALAYGFNPLTGRETERWRIRNVVRWCRPNPPVGDLADKVRPATSEMVVACTGARRYFDLDAVRHDNPRSAESHRTTAKHRAPERGGQRETNEIRPQNEAGAPPLDWWLPLEDEAAAWEEWRDQFGDQLWVIPTAPYKGSHYATWPPALCTRPIKAMCPERVCRTCGKPSERIVESTDGKVRLISEQTEQAERARINAQQANRGGRGQEPRDRAGPRAVQRSAATTGWTDCGHGDWRPGVVLDPFAGSGTTLAVATGHGRDAIGIDLDERNADLARQRVGMFLEVDERPTVEAAPA